MNSKFKISGLILTAFMLLNCDSSSSESTETTKIEPPKVTISAPDFDSQKAFEKVQTQVDFGIRLPNSSGHKKCGDWIVASMKENGLEVIEQEFISSSFSGKSLNARNIIASYNPKATKRILLAAHWDTREVADQDDEKSDQPIIGANDGASGVAVLIQLAESIASAAQKPNIGIDYIFFDVEDGGSPASFTGNPLNAYGGYCMGSEYWAKNKHKENYSAFYGILLDMVGAKGATFLKEEASMTIAPSVVNKIWQVASTKGFSSYFLPVNGPSIMDDHWPVVQHGKIPMIDIIDTKQNAEQTFFDHWHTHDDNMEAIDVNSLEAVGETVLQVLYEEEGVI